MQNDPVTLTDRFFDTTLTEVTQFASPTERLRQAIYRHIRYTLGRPVNSNLSAEELYNPTALALRDRLIDAMLDSEARYRAADAKRLYYLSMEFLMGRMLGDNLCNMRLHDLFEEVLKETGSSLDDVLDAEPDAGLGNGGLGRLAACFLESLATLGMPGFGYGINYEYGLFKQEIVNGYQREKPDRWKSIGTPFLIERPNDVCYIPLYGRVENSSNGSGRANWVDWKMVVGVPSDMPVAGYGGKTCNYLRLFTARASQDFDIEIFNKGDYFRAVGEKIESENISRVLYPSDSVTSGKELRLIQEYFLVSCALRDIIRRYRRAHNDFTGFPEKVAIQMNDTHPSLAVAELMRQLVDESHLEWKEAWEITTSALAYTNHTLLPEALERWSVNLMQYVLPRHMQIIYEINHRFLAACESSYCALPEQKSRMSIIEEGPDKQVRMASLAIIGSHSVNGVSALHTELLRDELVPDFNRMWPEKFNNKTNGVAHRRWMLKANPALSDLLNNTIGESWITDLSAIRELEKYADDASFREQMLEVKKQNKRRLAKLVLETTGAAVDSEAIFDVQIKRIHEYKRQLLNVLRIIHEYYRLIEDGTDIPVPRAYIFAGKAAPGYWAAKQIIKLINSVAKVVNSDPKVAGRMKVAFLPDYRVSLAEVIIPGADISEQISTAGMEASGTGNMKLQMNGALTLGTLDGANVEISEEVGAENIYIFGLRKDQVLAMQQHGTYHPREIYNSHEQIRRVVDSLGGDRFCAEEHGLFRWMQEMLLSNGERYFHLADLPGYIETSQRIDHDFVDRGAWARKMVLNIARSGKFSSDRTVTEYARDIWGIERLAGEPTHAG